MTEDMRRSQADRPTSRMPPASGPPGRRGRILLVAALPLLLGAVVVLQAATVGRPGSGGGRTPLEYLPGQFFPWLLLGLLAPAVYLFSERVLLRMEGWGRRVTAHVAAGLAFALVHPALTTTLHLFVYRPPDLTWPSFYRANLSAFLLSDLVQYILLAVASHALLFHARLREREVATLRIEALLAEARLRALRQQVSPHFLFNALNTVAALARRGDTDAVREVVGDLGDLLRLGLDDFEGPLVPVTRELERLERYRSIEKARYGSRLCVAVRVAPEVHGTAVPSMILQPLVENAIKHGLGRRRGDLHVDVELRATASAVEITIDDDGPGFPQPAEALRAGVGLGNLRRRLDELYGGRHRLELAGSDLGGARVRILLPREANTARVDGVDRYVAPAAAVGRDTRDAGR